MDGVKQSRELWKLKSSKVMAPKRRKNAEIQQMVPYFSGPQILNRHIPAPFVAALNYISVHVVLCIHTHHEKSGLFLSRYLVN